MICGHEPKESIWYAFSIVVTESMAWPISSSFLAVLRASDSAPGLGGVGLPFQFVCPLLFIDVTQRDGCGERFRKRFDPGRQ